MILSYVRVSTVEQAADGTTSLREQERKNKAIADLRGAAKFDFLNFVDAGVSGTIPLSERPAGKDMLAQAAKGDVIVANKLDRLFRSATDALVSAERFQKAGIDLILIDMGSDPVTGNGAARLFFTILAGVAQFERERIAERMEDGRKGKRARNGHVGGSAPYGFKVVGQGREASLEPDEEERDVLRHVKWLKQNRKYQDVTRVLNALGVRSRAGTELQIVQVQRMCKQARELFA